MTKAIVAVLAAVFMTAGCYTYAPVSSSTVSPDMTVRVEVATSGSDATVDRVEGRVFEVGPDAFRLLPETRPGTDASPRRIEIDEIQTLTHRQFNATRTALVFGAGAAVGIGALLLADSNPGDTRQPGGSGDFNLVPIVRALLSPGR